VESLALSLAVKLISTLPCHSALPFLAVMSAFVDA
jgi:hypothetical protein